MNFASLAAVALMLALPAFVQTETLSYDTSFDDPSLSLTVVACSDGSNGLITKGYTTLGSLPTFPFVGAVYTVTGWNSAACGTCYSVTYANGQTITVLAVDSTAAGFDISEEAMNALTGGQAANLGRVDVTAVPVDASLCGLN